MLKRTLTIAFLAFSLGFAGAARGSANAIDVQNSRMTVYVYKKGVFSFLADNHQIAAPITSGSYDAATKSVVLAIDAAKLTVLDPKLSEDKRASVQSAMEGPQVLDVVKYPAISFRSTNINQVDPSHWEVTGNLLLHGQAHSITLQVLRTDVTHFSGSTTISQTAFGIAPIRIAGGAVSVRDDVKVDFQIALKP